MSLSIQVGAASEFRPPLHIAQAEEGRKDNEIVAGHPKSHETTLGLMEQNRKLQANLIEEYQRQSAETLARLGVKTNDDLGSLVLRASIRSSSLSKALFPEEYVLTDASFETYLDSVIPLIKEIAHIIFEYIDWRSRDCIPLRMPLNATYEFLRFNNQDTLRELDKCPAWFEYIELKDRSQETRWKKLMNEKIANLRSYSVPMPAVKRKQGDALIVACQSEEFIQTAF